MKLNNSSTMQHWQRTLSSLPTILKLSDWLAACRAVKNTTTLRTQCMNVNGIIMGQIRTGLSSGSPMENMRGKSRYWRGIDQNFCAIVSKYIIHKSTLFLVLDLWVWWSHSWYWRIPRTATRPKYIWSSSDAKSMVEREVPKSKAKILLEKVGLWVIVQPSMYIPLIPTIN